jgi:hypothetical protein
MRYLKAVFMPAGSYYAGVLAAAIITVGLWGWEVHGYSNFVGLAVAVVQGVMGVSVFASLLDRFPTDELLRLRTAAVIAWGFFTILLGIAVLRVWLLGTPDFAWWWETAAAIAGTAPWCIWTVMMLRRPKASSPLPAF